MSKDWLATATLQPEDESPVVDKIFDDEVSIRRFFSQFRSQLVESAWAYQHRPFCRDGYPPPPGGPRS